MKKELIVFTNGCVSGNIIASKDKAEFAKCLTENNAVLYSAYGCSHCQNQKEMFGDEFQYINYVECTEKTTECNNAGVRGYPTWIINGQLLEGAQSFQTLAKLTGCTY